MNHLRPLIALAAALLLARPALAQTGSGDAAPHGSVSGTVVSAITGDPIGGAVVVLESSSDVSVVTPTSGAFLGRSLVAVTEIDGTYRFVQLAPGAYRLLVRHLG